MECDLGNITVFYEIYGEGKPIIFLHGWNVIASHRQWSEVVEPFFENQDGWQRIYIDLPGMGKTPGEDWITKSEDIVDILLRFIDQMIPDQKVSLAGLSYGGYLAQGIIYKKPNIANGLCLIVPMTRDRVERTLPEHVILVVNKELLEELNPEDAEIFRSLFVVQNRKLIDNFKAFQQAALGDEEFMSRLNENYAFSFDIEKLPHSFDKPTLIVTGRQDAIVGYQDQWNILQNYPRATFAVFDRTGHILMHEQEQLFINLLSEWLDRVEENIKLNSK